MKNVPLLVVNRKDRTKMCRWVRLVKSIVVLLAWSRDNWETRNKNAEKFLMNWFANNQKWVELDAKNNNDGPWPKYYKGLRDRLYRSGILDGRADDQVKIQRFRIELDEIDSNLSQHALIRDCKTLVRRDRNEEPSLGAEDVEDEGIVMGFVTVYWRKYPKLQTEVRDHLKTRLPVYAMPTIYIVLNKLLLNPNGKVYKPNLLFPEFIERTEEASEEELKNWESLTDIERAVA
ncbi:large subunit of alpha-aminoadipate reductase [Cytospora paraplurivora]|uniref:Large subunit of alpha-aminoadipate reductase n=1 Tax=Cytospora paraplurivora TaxID=2898453 RepID=A0AAN9TZ16_9PEZI